MKQSKDKQGRASGRGLRTWVIGISCLLAGIQDVRSQVLTLPLDQRPAWLQKEGMIMAGSWEPLTYRTRQGAHGGHVPRPEERAAWEYEHSAAVTQRLKDLGVNFVMMHCYKGAGMDIESGTMQDAVRFARQYHAAGLHVGVYVYSGAFLWEPMYREISESQNWALLDKDYKPLDYYQLGIRYYWDRNNPGAQAFYKRIIHFAVKDIGADLLHFDNYSQGPGRDANSVRRFRAYLRKTFTPAELAEMGASDLSLVTPPMNLPPRSRLDDAWLMFKAASLTDSYREMGAYARSLRQDILLELNCGGPGGKIRWIDHGQLLRGGEALWSEGRPSGYVDGHYSTRIISYKIARGLDNMVFYYANTPVAMAESMAFNTDCLGMVCGFQNGKIVSPGPDTTHSIKEVLPYIKFYKTRRALFRNATVVADLAVLRSYPSQVFSDAGNAALTARVEQYCVDQRLPFQILYGNQLDKLSRYRVLVLAGCTALSDTAISRIRAFTAQGGRLCIIGPVAQYNEWMRPRTADPFKSLPEGQVLRIAGHGDPGAALAQSMQGQYTASVAGPEGLYAEYTSVPRRRLVHLVNFRPERSVTHVQVRMALPEGQRVKRVLLASPAQEQDQELPFEEEGGRIRFTVPAIAVYGVAIVELEKKSS